ncbi:Helix-turn-helix domain-containing protein [Pseudomonas guineae]|uniref:Helix-turn-helix domain-containing protein n=1 Tax=Pseudomonas guineae TaxID=425504 RepID=A0A1I3KBY3_9PSED|nr:helix-turn-helix domain-containing protein [Pseudomonas guineae]SFI70016.1 Helix-turn-helix domain-containing protein [Pseudomonas guineae]
MANDNPNSNTSSSQCAAIRRHLETGKTITAIEALDAFGCFRLAARINDLINAGLAVERTLVAVINRDGKKVRVAEYSMRSAVQ